MCLNMFEPPTLLSASLSLCFSAWKVKNTAFAMPAARGTAMIGIISRSDVPAWTTCGFIHGKTWFTFIACFNGVTINLLHSLKLTYHLGPGHPKREQIIFQGHPFCRCEPFREARGYHRETMHLQRTTVANEKHPKAPLESILSRSIYHELFFAIWMVSSEHPFFTVLNKNRVKWLGPVNIMFRSGFDIRIN